MTRHLHSVHHSLHPESLQADLDSLLDEIRVELRWQAGVRVPTGDVTHLEKVATQLEASSRHVLWLAREALKVARQLEALED